MRVLHVNDHQPGPGVGGAEIYLARLVEAQRTLGHDVAVLAADHERQGLGRALDLWDPRALRRLRARVAELRPDVVHLHNVTRELSPAVLRPTGVATVMTFHDMRLLGGSEHKLPHPRAVAGRLWVDPVVRRLAGRLDAVTGVSDVVTSALRDAGLPHPTTLPVPVGEPTETLLPVQQCHDVVFAGRLSRDKGAHVLVAAFALVADRHPAARLVLAGDGPERAQLEAARGPRVELVGRLTPEEVSALMGRARVVVVPSLPALRREGSSLTAVEAARHARPVVGSDDPAVAEVAVRVGGAVVPAGDVQALARQLDVWLGDGEAAAEAGRQAAQAAAAVHDPARVAERADAVYRAALARG